MTGDEDIPIKYDKRMFTGDTDQALCVEIDGETHWFPRSCCRIYEKPKKIYVPEWIAMKKGLI